MDHDTTTHAQKRRAQSREAIRSRLRAGQYVRRLMEIAEKAETVEMSAVPALRLKADIYTRLLSKCLPDLKAIEHSGEIRQRDVTDQPLTDEEWARQYARDYLATPGGSAKEPH